MHPVESTALMRCKQKSEPLDGGSLFFDDGKEEEY